MVITDGALAAELLDVLARDAEPQGVLLLDGIDLRTVTLDSARAALLVARHDATLFEGTLADNIGAEDSSKLVPALVASGADEVRDTMPNGLDTEIGERGRTLSGGQRQRVALARALAADSTVLVLHDPTTAIDAATEDRIASGLARHRAGRSTLIITSSPSLLARCDRVIMIEQEMIIAEGRHTTLVDDPRLSIGGTGMSAPHSARGQHTLLPVATPGRTWQATLELLRGRRGKTALTLATLLASGIAIVFVPPLLGRLVDVVRDSGGRSAVDMIALGLLVALLARAIFTGLGQLLLARLGEQLLAQLRERVVRRAMEVPLETVERAGTGDLVQRTGGDITVISEGLRTALPAVARALIDVGLTLVGLTVLDWRLGLAGLAPLPIWIFATRWYLRTSGPRYAVERAADSAQTQSLVSSLTGAATVRAFRLQARHLRGIGETSDAAVRAGVRARATQSRFGAVLNGAEMVGVLSILVTGFSLVRSEAITLGAATAAAFYFTRLFSPLMIMLYLLDEAQSAGAALARLIGVTDLPAPAAPARPQHPGDASVDHLRRPVRLRRRSGGAAWDRSEPGGRRAGRRGRCHRRGQDHVGHDRRRRTPAR